jgi:hypothetical protein
MPADRRRVYRSRAARRRRSLLAVILLTALAAVLVIVGTSGGRDRVTYDRAAVAAYADRWALSANPDLWWSAKSDCANFVSQCVSAGGLRPLDHSGSEWHDNGQKFPTVGWVNCDRQRAIWSARSANHSPSYITSSTSIRPKSWDAGDVVYLGNVVDGRREWQHVIICVGKEDGQWVYDSHTVAHRRKLISTWFPEHFSLIRYCHMADAVTYR